MVAMSIFFIFSIASKARFASARQELQMSKKNTQRPADPDACGAICQCGSGCTCAR